MTNYFQMKKTRINAKEFCKTLSLSAAQLDTICKDMVALKDEINEQEVSETFAQVCFKFILLLCMLRFLCYWDSWAVQITLG